MCLTDWGVQVRMGKGKDTFSINMIDREHIIYEDENCVLRIWFNLEPLHFPSGKSIRVPSASGAPLDVMSGVVQDWEVVRGRLKAWDDEYMDYWNNYPWPKEEMP